MATGSTGYSIGIDFGTDSVRVLIVDINNGDEVSTAVSEYNRWSKGMYCEAQINQFRQHPLDYIESMESAINEALSIAGNSVKDSIIGIGIDTTGSTPCPVDQHGTPLALLQGFEENPNAMFHLWKDHTAVKEAKEINELNESQNSGYLKYVGGIYSSEWYWAKILHTHRIDPAIKAAAISWIEHCDWIPFLLTGQNNLGNLKRSRCAAGHKALWNESFKGLPDKSFFRSLEQDLAGISFNETYTSDIPAGTLSQEWCERLGLNTAVVVAVGAFDAHMGAVGGQIEPFYISKVIGTSTCDIMVADMKIDEKVVSGICGQVNGSVIPGKLGLEAGQSAFGDIYAWFKQILLWPLENMEIDADTYEKISEAIIPNLSKEAAKIEPGKDDPVSLDWLNGRRTPDANQALKGVISGLNLGTDAPRIFKSLVESTCFGSRMINERFISEGVTIDGVIALGGVAKKSAYVMQTLADVLNCPIRVGSSEQTCALGAAMFGATAAGRFNTVEEAMKSMGAGFDSTYTPDPKRVKIYDHLYEKYKALGSFIESSSN